MTIPAFALAEPHQALVAKKNSRENLINSFNNHLSELGRSKPYREISSNFGPLVTALKSRAAEEKNGLKSTIKALLAFALVIPLDSVVLAFASEIADQFDMSGQDAIILASVLVHLRQSQPASACFLNRNSADFDNPDVREELERFNCKYFRRFDDGLNFIIARLRKKS